jgi:hypothetical protein
MKQSHPTTSWTLKASGHFTSRMSNDIPVSQVQNSSECNPWIKMSHIHMPDIVRCIIDSSAELLVKIDKTFKTKINHPRIRLLVYHSSDLGRFRLTVEE